MSQDTETLVTLTVADTPLELQVIHFSGSEGLNRPYRFDIDLISPSDTLDVRMLTACVAYLSYGDGHHGVHGLISSALMLYVGNGISHFRVTLEPRLQSMQQRYHRRLLQRSSVPQILQRLLQEHGIGKDQYRFELTVGTYPFCATRAQYDENDLQLLQRLCAEEGIHYRFEHNRDRHLLIFADDPAVFRELPTPTHYQYRRDNHGPTISHMTEHFSIGSISPDHSTYPRRVNDSASNTDEPDPLRMPVYGFAANQARGSLLRGRVPDAAEARRRQLSARALERLRCERRQVYGLSDQPSLVSGRILSVLAHPDPVFNDQWLLTEVHHRVKQPHVLDGLDPADIHSIMRSAFREDDQSSPLSISIPDTGDENVPFIRGYRNHFRVIPWSLSYRPPLIQQKPQIHGPQTATLVGVLGHPAKRDPQGRVKAKLHWPTSQPNEEAIVWLPLAIATPADEAPRELLAGSQVLLSHFDNDPEQPVICGLVDSADPQLLRPRIWIDGRALSSIAGNIHLSPGQKLNVDGKSSVTLTSQHSRLEIHPASIRMTAAENRTGLLCQETELRYGPAPGRASKPDDPPTPMDFSALLQQLTPPQPDP